MIPQDIVGSDQRWEFGPAQGGMDLSQSPDAVGPGYVPILNGVDPRVLGAYRRLPGFHRVSETTSNSRILPADVDDTGTSVLVDYFQPVVMRFASQPHERRGWVVSANNKLIVKFYNTKTATWEVRTLVDDLDTTFETRTDFDVTTQGSFLYVSRAAWTDAIARTPHVFWWDDDEIYRVPSPGAMPLDPDAFADPRIVSTGNDGNFVVYVANAGSLFRSVGGAPWELIGTTDGSILALLPRGPGVYIGGTFTEVVAPNELTVSATNVAFWTGAEWKAMAGGLGAGTTSIKVLVWYEADDVVVAGGVNFTVGGCNCIAQWDGTAWSAMGTGTALSTDTVFGLAERPADNKLYIGGSFADLGGVADTQNLGRWNTSTNAYEALGAFTGANNTVRAVAVQGTSVWFGGDFTDVHGVTASKIARYSGAAWFPADGLTGSVVRIITNFRVLTGSGMVSRVVAVGGSSAGVDVWDGSVWTSIPATLNANVTDIVAMPRSRLWMVGYFDITTDTSDILPGIASWAPNGSTSSLTQMDALVGSGVWGRWGTPTLSVADATDLPASDPTYTDDLTGANFEPDAYYAVFVRFTDPARGLVTSPSMVGYFKVESGTEDNLRRLLVQVPGDLITASKPTRIEVWRTIASDHARPAGPFYFEGSYLIDTDDIFIASDTFTTRVFIGELPDDSLAGQDEFDPKYDLGGAHAAGSAIGAYKGLLFSLSGSLRPTGSDTYTEAFFDMRWSPPWNRNIEQTTYSGFHRTRISTNDSPRFVVCGEYLLLVSRGAVVRVQRAGDYLLTTDGPEGIGPCSIHACCPVGGDLWMVTNGGELVKMNASSGAVEGVMSVRRWFSTRWWHKVRSGEIGLAYDASSGCLYITAMRSSDDTTPQESLVIDTRTGRMTLLSDVSWRFARTGIDPETGRPTFFVIDQRGLIVAPDWQDRGVWEGNAQWTEQFFMTLLGNNQRSHELVTASTLEGDGSYTYPGLTYWPTDDGDPLLVDARAYAISEVPADEQHAEDPHTRYRLLGIGVVLDQTESSLTIMWDKLLQHGFTGDVDSVDTDVRIIVGPVPFQIVFPMLKDDNAPSLSDNIAVTDMTVYVGEVSTPAALE